jgi:hypothetical protein
MKLRTSRNDNPNFLTASEKLGVWGTGGVSGTIWAFDMATLWRFDVLLILADTAKKWVKSSFAYLKIGLNLLLTDQSAYFFVTSISKNDPMYDLCDNIHKV